MVLIRGLAVPWDEPSDDGAFVFRRGAFSRSLGAAAPICLQVNHGPAKLARDVDGSLTLWEAHDGLALLARIQSPTIEALLREEAFGPVHGLSVRWRSADRRDGTGPTVVLEAQLEEVSLITGRHRPRFSGTWAQCSFS